LSAVAVEHGHEKTDSGSRVQVSRAESHIEEAVATALVGGDAGACSMAGC
jgi:hypothetical protein